MANSSKSHLMKYNTEPIVRLSRYQELTDILLLRLLQNARSWDRRYDTLMDYYRGNHAIQDRYFEDSIKPNNKVVNNFASYITDVRTGYFTGIPIVYDTEDTVMLRDLESVLSINSSDDVTNELDRLTNIHGHAFELYWINEDKELRFTHIPANEMIMVYSSDVEMKPLYAIRHYEEKDLLEDTGLLKQRVFVYSKDSVTEYMYLQGETMEEDTVEYVGEFPHMLQDVPVIEYVNNHDRTSCFEDVASLIDAYNTAESDSVNEVQYFNDAYLVIKNLSEEVDNGIDDMKNNRVITVEGDGSVDWLTKSINDTYLEHLKERIAKDIHKFSKTPNLVSDEFISNLSGTAIRYKVWGLEQDASSKERKWKKSLRKRLKFIFQYLQYMDNVQYDIYDIEFVFNRNMPQNVMELGQMASQLSGLVSNVTLLSQIPFIDNPTIEAERVKEERQSNMEMFGIQDNGHAPSDSIEEPVSNDNSSDDLEDE